jgi:hypothetical protein
MIRIILIVDACLCFVIGAKWIAWDVVYHVILDPITVSFNIFAFVPLIALAPRYKNGKVAYSLIALLEVFVIFLGYTVTLR